MRRPVFGAALTLNAIAILAATALLAGCAASGGDVPTDPKQRIATAKRQTQAFERRIGGLVTEEDVVMITQLPDGSLQSCESGDSWAGGVTIGLRPDVRPEAVLVALGRKAAKSGLDVATSAAYDGSKRLTVTDTSGVSILLDSADHAIEGGSFSQCFSLPDDFYKGGSF